MAKKPYKWDQAKWEKDDEWWNPYNKVGRLKGKGSTTWARQARRAAQFAGNTDQQPLEKGQKEKKTEAMEVIQEETQQPLEKRKKTTDDPKEKGAASKKLEPKKAEKEAASGASASSSSGEHAKPLEKEAVKEKPEKPLEKDAAKEEPGKPLEKGKATEEVAKPLEKRQAENEPQKKEESKPVETELAAHEPAKPLEKGQAKNEPGQEAGKPLETAKQEPAPEPTEEEWQVATNKRKKKEKQAEKKTYLDVVVKGGLQDHKAPKQKQRTSRGYVSLGSESASSSRASSQKGTPAQPARMSLLEPLQKRQGVTEPLEKRQEIPRPLEIRQRLALDWHNVFQLAYRGEDYVPNAHIRAFWDLQAEGFEIYLLTFCGRERGDTVVKWAKSLPIKWGYIKVVGDRCGPWGKAEWAKHLGCTHLVDDNADICKESLEKGLKVYPVTTRHEHHTWAKKEGLETYRDFVKVVEALVDD